MPSSFIEGKQTTSKWLSEINPKTALDLGPGCGTYEYIMRGIYGTLVNGEHEYPMGSDVKDNIFYDYIQNPDCNMTGVEAYYPYIADFKLKDRYQKIIVADVRYLDWGKMVSEKWRGNYQFARYDVGFAGDILEHMTVEEAKEIVAHLKLHCHNVIISIPIVHFGQGNINNNPFEVHVEEDWTNEKVIAAFGTPKDSFVGQNIGVYRY